VSDPLAATIRFYGPRAALEATACAAFLIWQGTAPCSVNVVQDGETVIPATRGRDGVIVEYKGHRILGLLLLIDTFEQQGWMLC
jgi:hypothetical protein